MAVYLQRGIEDFVRGGEFGVGYMAEGWDGRGLILRLELGRNSIQCC